MSANLFNYLLKLGDDRVVMGQRMAEWCGVGPILEEDVALTNLCLDFIGQGVSLLGKAGEIEGLGRNEDSLAFFRDDMEYKNTLLVEQPNGDFAQTIAKLFFFSTFDIIFLNELTKSKDEYLTAFAIKSLKEAKYHFRHSSNWFLRLGDGTEESNSRLQNAIDNLWLFTDELFDMDEADLELVNLGIAVDLNIVKAQWLEKMNEFFTLSKVKPTNPDCFMIKGGRKGIHTEHLGKMLAEMQILPRTYPDAQW